MGQVFLCKPLRFSFPLNGCADARDRIIEVSSSHGGIVSGACHIAQAIYCLNLGRASGGPFGKLLYYAVGRSKRSEQPARYRAFFPPGRDDQAEDVVRDMARHEHAEVIKIGVGDDGHSEAILQYPPGQVPSVARWRSFFWKIEAFPDID